jgi:hypothetical protein
MSNSRLVFTAARGLVLAAVLIVFGCAKPTAPSASASTAVGGIIVVQGNTQIAQAGRPLANPIVLRIVDANGKGMAKQSATLIVAAGGGTVTPPTALSDSSGEMKLVWTLGSATTIQSLIASVGETTQIAVSATAIFPTDLIVAQGTAQTAKVATVLKNSVVVRVLGPGSVPMVGVTVTFQVTAGGGAISPQSAVTNTLGEVTAVWTLGAVAGLNTVVAQTGNLAGVTISATATP